MGLVERKKGNSRELGAYVAVEIQDTELVIVVFYILNRTNPSIVSIELLSVKYAARSEDKYCLAYEYAQQSYLCC